MINQYKPFDIKTLKHEYINNWFFCKDAYNDLCACFEYGNRYIELRIYPLNKGYGIIALYGDSLNNIKRKKTLFKHENKADIEIKFKDIMDKNTPESLINKYMGVLLE